jgi:hypothetical protein
VGTLEANSGSNSLECLEGEFSEVGLPLRSTGSKEGDAP